MGTNLIQQLRLRDMFGNQPVFGGQVNREPLFQVPEITIPTSPPETPKRTTPFMDQYRQSLLNAPRREDYQTGKIGKILALAAGTLGGATEGASRGIALGRDILDRPYNRAVEDYGMKLGRFKELADLEHTSELEGRKFELDARKLTLDELKTFSGMQLDDARAKELLNRIKNSGKKLERNELTGALELIDTNTGSRQSLGQFAETPDTKREKEFGFFKKREGVQQAGREKLERIRFGNDQSLTRLRASLDKENNSATQNNAAFEGAYQEAVFNNPGLVSKIFDKDDKGNLVQKAEGKYDPKDYQTFVAKVNQRMNAKLGKNFNDVNFPTVEEPTSEAVPTVSDPAQNALRQTAIQFLRDNNFEEDEASIAEAMKQIGSVSGVPTAPEPSLVPTVTVPQEPVRPTGRHGLLRNQGPRSEGFFRTPWRVDPRHTGPLFKSPFSKQDLPLPVRQMIDPGSF